ncbi:RING/U-box superfamily protein, putative isoform 2 [Hibiscus syriacus]|uniref:RING-type E3 ubiquitin transferase n=1 Tax=Hibiscus syriacus TaxID=106335 RepID=A0A6A3BCN2_HIBSY|nr:putative RING-H2 finger protein ATL21A [Hibiscus syriacus]KAE8713791.1 RING/U-box superfamily protein, putative isoform 2 [Hibiscus syriacus]
MNASFFFILSLSIVLLPYAAALDAISPPAKCGPKGFKIMSPFRLKTQHHGDPSFGLFCRNNSTIIHFPFYGDLVVKSISYGTRKLDLLDSRNCVHEVFLNLDLSHTPFHYFYVVKNYTYLNCSASIGSSIPEIPCLSGSQHHVYTVESYLEVPDSCRTIKTVAIPFAYSSYLSDSSFGLGLTWELPQRHDFGFQFKRTCFHLPPNSVPMIVGLILLATAAAVTMLKKMKDPLYHQIGFKRR